MHPLFTLFYLSLAGMLWLSIGLIIYFLTVLSEQALVALSAHELDALRTQAHASAKRAVAHAEQLRSSMAALLLARLLLVIAVCTCLTNSLLQTKAFKTTLYDFSQNNGLPGWLVWGTVFSLLSVMLSLILWGIHKTGFINSKSSKTGFWLERLSGIISVWRGLFKPFIHQKKKEKSEDGNGAPSPETEQIPAAVREKRELELLKSIVQFGDVTVKQVMQPRSKVVAVDFRTGFPELINTVCEAEFSRLPVIDEDLDNVTGILYVKDLVPFLDKPDDFEWQSLIRTNVMVVPESKRGSELLEEFKKEKLHMAIVVDEYGGSAGIVTLEDILEEVIGDIRDEFDEESEIRFRKLDDSNYLFEGQTLLNDVCRITGLPANAFDAYRGNSDTLAGLALELRGDIPAVGEEIACGQYMLAVVAADSRRIDQIKLTIA